MENGVFQKILYANVVRAFEAPSGHWRGMGVSASSTLV